MPKTQNKDTSVLAKLLLDRSISFECIDITKESYDLLLRKREAAISLEKEFEEEGNRDWFDMIVAQTDYCIKSYEEYSKEMARYIYVTKQKISHTS